MRRVMVYGTEWPRLLLTIFDTPNVSKKAQGMLWAAPLSLPTAQPHFLANHYLARLIFLTLEMFKHCVTALDIDFR
jgi:hypothetical protein